MFIRLREALEQDLDFAGLVKLYGQRADAVGGEEALLLHLTVAELWAPRAGDVEAVKRSVRAAMRLGEGLGREGLEQVRESLKELFWARGDWSGMAELLEQEARQTSPGASRARLWMELGELRLAKLGQPADGAAAYEAASQEPDVPRREIRLRLKELWEQAPTQESLFLALVRVYEDGHAGDEPPQRLAAELLDLLSRRLERMHEADPKRLEWVLKAGALCADALGDVGHALSFLGEARALGATPEAALGPLERLLARVGDEPELLAALRALHRAQERWDKVVELGRREAAVLAEPLGRAAVLRDVGVVLEEELDDLAGACALFREAVALDPGLAEEFVIRLRGKTHAGPARERVVELLKDLYRRRGEDQASSNSSKPKKPSSTPPTAAPASWPSWPRPASRRGAPTRPSPTGRPPPPWSCRPKPTAARAPRWTASSRASLASTTKASMWSRSRPRCAPCAPKRAAGALGWTSWSSSSKTSSRTRSAPRSTPSSARSWSSAWAS
jgi:tetratricopeptide (TPR) repeat protein